MDNNLAQILPKLWEISLQNEVAQDKGKSWNMVNKKAQALCCKL
jgi:hypothetical protein